ncbi:hypothetical protein EI555_009169, partial [Monodon monoceros]
VLEEALQKGKKVKGGPELTDNPSDIQGPVTATATPEAMAREEDEQRNCEQSAKAPVSRAPLLEAGRSTRPSLQVAEVPRCWHEEGQHNDPIGRSPGVAVSKTGPAAGTASIDAAEEKELVQTLLGAQTRHVGTMFDQFVQFRALISAASSSSVHPSPALSTQFPVLPLLTHFADINTFMVEQIIRLTKDLPLSKCHIALNATFCLQTQNFLCGLLRYTEDGVHGHCANCSSRSLEYRPGITQREGTDQLQEEIALTLQSYIKGQQQNPRDRFLYAKLLGRLADLRSINNACWYQIENIQGTVHHGATAPGDLQLRPSSPPSPDHLDMLDWKGENARTRGWSQ